MTYNILENAKEYIKGYNILCDDSINDDMLNVTEFYMGGKYITVEMRLLIPGIYDNYIVLNSIGIDSLDEHNDLYIKFYVNSYTKIPEMMSITDGGEEGLDFYFDDNHIPLHLSIKDNNLIIFTNEYLEYLKNKEKDNESI